MWWRKGAESARPASAGKSIEDMTRLTSQREGDHPLARPSSVSRARYSKVLDAEEKRLKALRDGLKSDANLQRKKDRLAEETRQRQLRAQIAEAKRRQVLAEREAARQQQVDALKFRHAVQPSRDMQIY